MSRLRGWVFAGFVAWSGMLAAGCSGGSGQESPTQTDDGGTGAATDSGASATGDSGQGGDEAATPNHGDAAPGASDGGPETTEGGSSEAGAPDGGAHDGGAHDGGSVGTGSSDGGTSGDAGANDGGPNGTGAGDGGMSADAGVADSGSSAADGGDAGSPLPGPAVLTISDGPTYAYGSHTDGAVVSHTFTVNNTGGSAATSLVVTGVATPFAYAGAAYPGTEGTCTTTLAAGSPCTFVVEFAPTSPGTADATLSVAYFDGVAAQSATRSVTGAGVAGTGAAVLAISDGPTYDFGPVTDGSSVTHGFIVGNTGGATATSLGVTGVTTPYSFSGGYPGTGGTCAATLAAGANCTLVLTFAPASAGLATMTMAIGYNDGTTTQSASRSVTGSGGSAAVLSISDGATYDFGPKTEGLSASHTFTVDNTGGSPATNLTPTGVTAPFAFVGGAYPGTGGTCTGTLAASSNCSLVLAFAPTTPGLATATLALGYSDGLTLQSATRALTGTGLGPAMLAISDGPTYSFGTAALNAEVDHLFYVTNTGGVPASAIVPSALAAPFAFVGGTFPGMEGTCGAVLQPSASCIVAVSFMPTVAAGASSTLTLQYDNGLITQAADRDVTGTGTTVGVLAIADWQPALYSQYGLPSDPATFDYGAHGLSSATDHAFFVTNTGAAAVSAISGGALAAPYSYKGGTFPGAGGGCGSTLAAGATCAVVVTFTPTAAGATPATLSIGYSDGITTHTATRALTGTGTAGAALTVYDYDTGNGTAISLATVYDYGSVGLGATTSHGFVVINAGASTATSMGGALNAPFAYAGGTYPGTGGTCGGTLAAGTECSLVVAFSPTVAGLASGTVNVAYTSGSTPESATRPIQGTGTPQALLVISDNETPSLAYGYGTVASGSSVDGQFTVTNQGASDASAISAGALASPFTFKGGAYPGTGGTCGTTLAAGDECMVVVTFAPISNATTTTALALSYDDGVATQSASRTIAGTGTTAALLSISQCSGHCGGGPGGSGTANFGTSGQPVDWTFYVTNSGAQSATSVVGTGLTAPFAFKGNAYPGTGGTCGSTIAVGASCTVVVTFTPSGNGTTAETLSVGYYDGAATQSTTQDLSGTSTTLAELGIFDSSGSGVNGSPYNFGTTGVLESNTFYVRNAGAQSATSLGDGGTLSSGFAYAGGSYPGTGGTCTATLATGATCTVVVTFTPSGSGPQTGVLTLAYNDGSNPQTATRALTGTATTQAILTIYDGQGGSQGGGSGGPQPYDFGLSGTPVTATFNLQNSGGGSAVNLSGVISGSGFTFAGGYPGAGGTCSATLTSGTTCSLVVTYTPSGNTPQPGMFTIDYQGGIASAVQRSLMGTPTTLALLGISDYPGGQNNGPPGTPFDYGTAGIATDHTFYVENTGGATATAMGDGATLAGGFAFKGAAYPGAGGTCGSTLPVGSTCTVVVTYTPSGSGLQSSTLTIGYQGGGSPSAVRSITGTATNLALVSINGQSPSGPPTTYNFGTTGVATTATFNLTNLGGGAATALGDGGTLGNGFAFAGGFPGNGGTCSTSLAIGASCSVVVTYTPSGTNPQSSTLTISYQGGSSATVAQALTGMPTTLPLLMISDFPGGGGGGGMGTNPPYDYGTWGVSVYHTFYVANVGGAPATAMSDGGTLGSGFAFVGGYPGTGGTCSTGLAVGAPCTVIVTYTPSGTSPQSSTLTINYQGGSSPSVTRSLTGTPTNLALLTLGSQNGIPGPPGSPYDYGTTGIATDATFNVTNTGGAPATMLGDGGTLGGGFAFKGTGFPGNGGTCTTSLPGGATCTVVVTYTPSGTVAQTSSLTLSFQGGTSATTALGLTGTPTSLALLTITDYPGSGQSGPSFSYGTWGIAVDHTFYVTNTGGAVATSIVDGGTLGSGFAFTGGYPGTGGTCTTSLTNGSPPCTVVVTYTPAGTGGQASTLTLGYQGGIAPTATRAITGMPTSRALLTVSENSGLGGCGDGCGPFSFGSVPVTTADSWMFTVTNTGALATTTIVDSGALAAPFGYVGNHFPGTNGTCTGILNPGASCSLNVQFAPTSAVTSTSDLVVTYADTSGGGLQAGREVQGTGH